MLKEKKSQIQSINQSFTTYHVDLEIGCSHKILLILRPRDVLEDLIKRVWNHTLEFWVILHTWMHK